MINADQALLRLKEGNEKFYSSEKAIIEVSAASRSEQMDAQYPFAIILGCSDSRVPVELIFGQGPGDLFVIRVAGNVVAPSQIGSVEFAAKMFGTKLVIVLGHSMCGAVQTTLDELAQPTESRSPNLHSIVDRIRPGIENLISANQSPRDNELLARAVRANIEASVEGLRHGSEILETLIQNQELKIVGAEYSLESGVVEFL
ncbi:MAG: carbonic anhydrase [Proteobacteria bacterium]|nr:carbonic anhydrase [Pseudomonadota bacterium]